MKRRFSTDEIATMLGVSQTTVYRMIKEGKLDAVRAGRTYVITRTHLVDYAGSEAVADDLISVIDDPDDEDA